MFYILFLCNKALKSNMLFALQVHSSSHRLRSRAQQPRQPVAPELGGGLGTVISNGVTWISKGEGQWCWFGKCGIQPHLGRQAAGLPPSSAVAQAATHASRSLRPLCKSHTRRLML